MQISGLGNGVVGREDEWIHDSKIALGEVTGICGFWDGSCNNNMCGAGIAILLYTHGTGLIMWYKMWAGTVNQLSRC